jgi:polysaccharide biosynthesis transport protein
LPRNASELSLNLAKFGQIALRRRWWFLLTASVISIAAVVVSLQLPNLYMSEATLLVVQQQVPERYVVPNTTSDLDEELQTMTQDVLSRSQLLGIINDLDLYHGVKTRLGEEQAVQLMRKDIELESIQNRNRQDKGPNAFKISYTGSSPEIAREVTDRLTSLFINEDLKTQEQEDTDTTGFLQSQLATAETDLNKKEEALRNFKMQNLGTLPEQQTGNLQILSGLEMQLQNTAAALERANEQRVFLQSLLAQYQTVETDAGPLPGASSSSPVETAKARLADLESQRAALLGSYSPEYPDVRTIDGEIARTKSLLAQLKTDGSKDDGQDASKASMTGGSATTDITTAQMKSQLKENQVEIANDTTLQKQLQEQIGEYQHRLNLTPVREQQLTDLQRAYDLAKKNYDDLFAKKTESALATDLAKNQQGQQFRLIDPANLPSKPLSPDRPKMAVFGLVGGLFAGAVLAFFMEKKDGSFHSEDDVRVQFAVPLVVGLPLSLTKKQKRMRSFRIGLEWLAGTVVVLAAIAAQLYVNLRG